MHDGKGKAPPVHDGKGKAPPVHDGKGKAPPVHDGDDGDGSIPPTKRSSSFTHFRDESMRVARLLDDVGFVSRKRIDLYDSVRVGQTAALARELRDLSVRFARWPHLPGSVVAQERDELVPRLIIVMREALAILQAMPSAGALGPLRRP